MIDGENEEEGSSRGSVGLSAEKRYFEGDVVAELYSQNRPRPPARLISRVIEFLVKETPGPTELKLALDVGCGSGQNTALIAPNFRRVTALDISSSQIDQAIRSRSSQLANVTFLVGSAEKLPAGDASVQLVTSCTAAHWFQLDAFFEECRRVLVQSGVIALYCNKMFSLCFKPDRSKDNELNEILKELCFEKLKAYWPPEIEIWQNEYRSIQLPFKDVTREYNICEEADIPLSTVMGRIRSWPAYQKYAQVNGENAAEELVKEYRRKSLKVLGRSEEEDFTCVTWINNYFLLMGRK